MVNALIVAAQPRAVTARQHETLLAKAAATPDRQFADAIRRQADRLVDVQQPMAPRRADVPPGGRRAATVAKAAKADDEPIPVFNAAGKLIGICDPADLKPVAETAGAQQVQKTAGTVVWTADRRPHVVDRGSVRTTRVRPAAKTAAGRRRS